MLAAAGARAPACHDPSQTATDQRAQHGLRPPGAACIRPECPRTETRRATTELRRVPARRVAERLPACAGWIPCASCTPPWSSRHTLAGSAVWWAPQGRRPQPNRHTRWCRLLQDGGPGAAGQAPVTRGHLRRSLASAREGGESGPYCHTAAIRPPRWRRAACPCVRRATSRAWMAPSCHW